MGTYMGAEDEAGRENDGKTTWLGKLGVGSWKTKAHERTIWRRIIREAKVNPGLKCRICVYVIIEISLYIFKQIAKTQSHLWQ